MIQTILIGPAEGPVGGGIAQFILFLLHYRPLLVRLAAAAAVWRVSAWLEWTAGANLGFIVFEVYASLLAIRFIVGVSQWRQLGQVLAAMWLPIGVIAVAAYLLFWNDQGRELGVGLMDSDANAVVKGLFLAPVLIYWACNNWLSARLGLRRAFPNPESEQVMLFWGPRVVGVLAHLLAASSLSAAALSQNDLLGKDTPLVYVAVFAAPAAILLAAAFVRSLDYGYVSERSNIRQQRLARAWMYPIGGAEVLVFVGLVFAWYKDQVPLGFLWATLFITGSAFVFLTLISWLRRKAPLGGGATPEAQAIDALAEQSDILWWTRGLAALLLAGTVAIWFDPMHVGQFLGSLTVACYSFASFLAVANVVDLTADRLAQYARGAGFLALAPRAVAGVFLCFLVIPALLTSLTRSFHPVRVCEKKNECTPAPAAKGWSAIDDPARRPTVSKAALAWYAQAEPVYHSLHPGGPVPMLVVATAGGGIRAAYWTATILESLHAGSPELSSEEKAAQENLIRHLLFAVSGVSGGSVGAAAYAAAVHAHDVNGTPITPTDYLQEDFLAPGLASLIFIDGPANVLPDLGQIDRGQALELGFEYASRGKSGKDALVSHAFLSFFPAVKEDAKLASWRPALLFNATHKETGRRIITSHLKIERDVFVDSYDALQVLGADVRLSTAAHNSARFTYVSPAGNLVSTPPSVHNRGYVIDGGYFENYGAETALELAREAIDAINAHNNPNKEKKVKLVVLQISSDPELEKDRTLVRAARPQAGAACTVSTFGPAEPSTEPGGDGKRPTDAANYLTVIDPVPGPLFGLFGKKNEGESYVFSYANELSAPLVGIMSVRQAHGTLAAAELAASICQGKAGADDALRNGLKRKVAARAPGGNEATAGVEDDAPHFSHMAMCQESWIPHGTGVNPPLGWVLSKITRLKFADILKDCGNPDELKALKRALGLPPSASPDATKQPVKDTAG